MDPNKSTVKVYGIYVQLDQNRELRILICNANIIINYFSKA